MVNRNFEERREPMEISKTLTSAYTTTQSLHDSLTPFSQHSQMILVRQTSALKSYNSKNVKADTIPLEGSLIIITGAQVDKNDENI